MQRNVSENGRERGVRIDGYIYPLRVASDVDDGLEEPKHSANYVMARDTGEIWRAPTPENVCATIFLRNSARYTVDFQVILDTKDTLGTQTDLRRNRKNIMFRNGDIYCRMNNNLTTIYIYAIFTARILIV